MTKTRGLTSETSWQGRLKMAPTHPLHACIRSGDVSLVSSRVGSVSQPVISRPPRIPHTFQISRHDSGTRTDDDFLKEPHIYTP